MFIDANEIVKLIQACKDVKERMAPESHMIHVDDIAATLQELIDNETARQDKMVEQEREREDMLMEKDLIMFQDWPGGL